MRVKTICGLSHHSPEEINPIERMTLNEMWKESWRILCRRAVLFSPVVFLKDNLFGWKSVNLFLTVNWYYKMLICGHFTRLSFRITFSDKNIENVEQLHNPFHSQWSIPPLHPCPETHYLKETYSNCLSSFPSRNCCSVIAIAWRQTWHTKIAVCSVKKCISK